MKIISWNVNGIRAVTKKGFVDWLHQESPDIVCLQETKAQYDQFPEELKTHPNYHISHSSAEKKGYSGVATLSKIPFIKTTLLDIDLFDSEGRVLIHEGEHFFLINAYFPNGQRDHNRVPYKLNFCEEILAKVNDLKKIKPVIITGDFNTAHQEIDLANPKSNIKTTGFLPIEREWMDKFIANGFIDIFRSTYPDRTGAYTWWSHRPTVRERNIGWRIDYFFITPDLLPHVKETNIFPEVKGSDHCPIGLELSLKNHVSFR